MSQFQLRLRRRNVPDVELLDDLRATARGLGQRTITAVQYAERGSFGSTTILRRFGTWNVGLEKAELTLTNRIGIPNDELFENIAFVWTSLGRQPFGRHMADKTIGSQYSLGTYEKRFGSWNNALIAFVQYIENGQSVRDGEIETENARDSILRKRTPKGINWRLRARILIRDSCICKMCGASPAKNSETVLHVDHIFAWANGGETVEDNLQTLCEQCNIGKSNVL